MTDEDIRNRATAFAKQNKSKIAVELTDPNIYLPDSLPISVFMAGSPGAGKTEFSRNLVSILEDGQEHRVVRIDGDDLRQRIPGYTGANSYLFQGAVSLIVEKMHDRVLHNSQTFVLDGTFSKYDKAADNIRRSLQKKRSVFIFYVYQDPEIAWRFTEAREKAEGRRIPKAAFIEQFFGAMTTVERVREEFGTAIAIFFVKKNFEKNTVESLIKIEPKGTAIDEYTGEHYTAETLEQLL